MTVAEYGDVTTPIDDPCQFNPAWRAIVAEHLMSSGVYTAEDLKSVSLSGCVTVTRTAKCPEKEKSGGARPKGRKKAKTPVKPAREKVPVPVEPFASSSMYRPYASDKWIASYISMRGEYMAGLPASDGNVPMKLASRWYEEMDSESAMKKRLEPMLLTGVDMDVIAMDLLGRASYRPAIEAYERLYFNCREDDWSLNGSMQLVTKMAMPWGPLKTFLRKWESVDEEGFVRGDGRPLAKDSDVWKAIAATMGYEALMYVWKWNDRAHGMKSNTIEHMLELSWKVAASRMFIDLYNGDMKHEDAARVLAAYSAHAKNISDNRKDGGEGGEMAEAFLALLGVAAPKMRELVSGGAGMITDNDIRARIESQQAIDKTHIQDAGKQVQDEIIEAQISDAIDG